MARKPRIEFPGAIYHVINRGNYRSDIFVSDKVKYAFEKCLGEACDLTGWRIHAYIVMRNHFHLAIETPRGNLVTGMQWLQATFAARFNKYRQENGHLFQGRYKSILLERGSDLAYVVNYIHLNPVKAGFLPAAQLKTYPWSSFAKFQIKKRPAFLSCADWLNELGGLKDTRAGWRSYQDYLAWLAENESEQKRQNFEKMCQGWAMGSKEWRKALVQDYADEITDSELRDKNEVADLLELQWHQTLQALLARRNKSGDELARHRKGADWKVALAEELRRTTSATNRWIAQALHMGTANSVSFHLSRFRRAVHPSIFEFGA
jgi:REP element-mobilizing transposase RayT